MVAAAIGEAFPEISIPAELCEEAWEILTRLNDLSAVIGNIPSGMMTHIETMAAMLATDLQSASVDMSNIDLARLGEQVLSKCTDQDMSHFADNLDNLMPVVQSGMLNHPSLMKN